MTTEQGWRTNDREGTRTNPTWTVCTAHIQQFGNRRRCRRRAMKDGLCTPHWRISQGLPGQTGRRRVPKPIREFIPPPTRIEVMALQAWFTLYHGDEAFTALNQ